VPNTPSDDAVSHVLSKEWSLTEVSQKVGQRKKGRFAYR
jgi:hypothetical protein